MDSWLIKSNTVSMDETDKSKTSEKLQYIIKQTVSQFSKQSILLILII